jgi:wobble nucleotide-excising tRNase
VAAITKIHTLRNVGLFENGVPQPLMLSKANLFYAENGRGKSTLATVLRSCGENAPALVTAKKTLDTEGPIKIGLLHGTTPLAFEDGVWKGSPPNVALFDSEFVERNVYTGQEVRPDQRQSLLEFALGDAAVALKQEVDQLTAVGVEATKRKVAAERILTAYRDDLTLEIFRSLAKGESLDEEIEKLKNQVAIARQQSSIQKRPNLSLVDNFEPKLDGVFSVLATALANIHEAAEQVVLLHIKKHGEEMGVEDWLAVGQKFVADGSCPFCGQEIGGSELIAAYQSYFNDAYGALKTKVAGLDESLRMAIPDSVITTIQKIFESNVERVLSWNDELKIPTHNLNIARLKEILTALQNEISLLIESKKASPLDAIGTVGDVEKTSFLISEFNALVSGYVDVVKAINAEIAAYKEKLAGADIQQLESAIKKIGIQKKRYDETVVNAFAEYDASEGKRKEVEQKKIDARKKLDTLMEGTLAEYRNSINAWLSKFGASFSLEEMKPNYLGGGLPRTEYGLMVRKRSVKLGSRGTDGPAFGNTLSEGDKRTLAFAFFMARVCQRADKKSLIVVIDDPVSSLDKHRRAKTKFAIGMLSADIEQLIVLSHDAYFLKDLKRFLEEKVGVETTVSEVKAVENDYSAICSCDLAAICSSDYYRHYVLVQDFVDAIAGCKPEFVSKVLRVLVEGHLRRRFPKHVREGVPLGVVIDAIKNAPNGNPLEHLKHKIQELNDFNDYASQFHHDSQNAEVATINATELRGYAKQALSLIHTGNF